MKLYIKKSLIEKTVDSVHKPIDIVIQLIILNVTNYYLFYSLIYLHSEINRYLVLRDYPTFTDLTQKNHIKIYIGTDE